MFLNIIRLQNHQPKQPNITIQVHTYTNIFILLYYTKFA